MSKTITMETPRAERYKNKYRIASARADWHDYDGGFYFVTICTKNREFYFGEISECQMILSDIGEFAKNQFQNVTSLYPYAEIPAFVVMPNHIHAIVVIDDRIARRDAIHRVSDEEIKEMNKAFSDTTETEQSRGGITGRSNPMLYNNLGAVIRGLKARVTHYSNENNIVFGWQSRFHDRIIRDQRDMNETAKYIEDNVIRWREDEMYK